MTTTTTNIVIPPKQTWFSKTWIGRILHKNAHSGNDSTGSLFGGGNIKTKKMADALNTPYFNSLANDTVKKATIASIVSELNKDGITSPYTIAAFLAIISKESDFKLVRENLNYTSAALQKVFGLDAATADRLASITDGTKQEQIANTVYMPPHNTQLGNTQPGDGWTFRGAGWNQLTGRGNAKKVGAKIGVDLESDFDKLNTPQVATDALLAFFKDGLAALKANGSLAKYYNNTTGDINGFPSEADATAAFYNVNAGTGQTQAFLLKDVTGGRALAMGRSSGFLNYV